MRLIQLRTKNGVRHVAVTTDYGKAKLVAGAATVYELSMDAIRRGISLPEAVGLAGLGEEVDYAAALREGRVL